MELMPHLIAFVMLHVILEMTSFNGLVYVAYCRIYHGLVQNCSWFSTNVIRFMYQELYKIVALNNLVSWIFNLCILCVKHYLKALPTMLWIISLKFCLLCSFGFCIMLALCSYCRLVTLNLISECSVRLFHYQSDCYIREYYVQHVILVLFRLSFTTNCSIKGYQSIFNFQTWKYASIVLA